jgi:RHS repeat-associated protein
MAGGAMGYAPRPYVPASATGASSTTGEPTTISGGSSQPLQFSWSGDGSFDGLTTYRNFNSSTNGFTTTTDKTGWELDPARRWPVAKNYSDGTRIQMRRDAVGNLREWVGACSITNTYSRDAADQITGLAYSDGTPGVSYTYSLRGLITNLLDAAGNHDFVYDNCNRVTSETGTNLALTMTYCTNSDERASLTLAMGGTDVLTVDYAFGAAGRLTGVTASQPGGAASGLTFRYDWYTNENRIAALCAANGLTNQYQYQTNADLVSAIRIWGAARSAAPLLAYTYAYDDADRCTNFARPYESRRDLYAYDAAGYLVKAQRQVTGVWSTAQWCFDTSGNRVSEINGITGRSATQAHNALNQLRSCSYDLDGNLTANGTWSYTWDAENRLTSAVSNGTTIATYQYDAYNRRISKTVGSTTHQYLYDGWNLVAEVRSQGSEVSTNLYVWGADHTGSLAIDSGGVRGLLAIISGSSVYYPVMNNHGDVMALFDSSGTNIVARYERDPFGVLVSATGPAADLCPFGFQTKYCDQETGLIYFGHRYYEPTLAAWLCRDPLEEEGGINLYGVTGGDPVNGIDPLGLAVDRDVTAGQFNVVNGVPMMLMEDREWSFWSMGGANDYKVIGSRWVEATGRNRDYFDQDASGNWQKKGAAARYAVSNAQQFNDVQHASEQFQAIQGVQAGVFMAAPAAAGGVAAFAEEVVLSEVFGLNPRNIPGMARSALGLAKGGWRKAVAFAERIEVPLGQANMGVIPRLKPVAADTLGKNSQTLAGGARPIPELTNVRLEKSETSILLQSDEGYVKALYYGDIVLIDYYEAFVPGKNVGTALLREAMNHAPESVYEVRAGLTRANSIGESGVMGTRFGKSMKQLGLTLESESGGNVVFR